MNNASQNKMFFYQAIIKTTYGNPLSIVNGQSCLFDLGKFSINGSRFSEKWLALGPKYSTYELFMTLDEFNKHKISSPVIQLYQYVTLSENEVSDMIQVNINDIPVYINKELFKEFKEKEIIK
jgi:hypothetical protein